MAKRKKKADPLREKVLGAIPSSWLDPLLSGPQSITLPATGPQIEALLRAVHRRVDEIFEAHAQGKGGGNGG
jgi:hypothetical protein